MNNCTQAGMPNMSIVTRNCNAEAIRKRPMSMRNIGLRPHLSVAQPISGAPMKMPNSGPAATRPRVTSVRPRSCWMVSVTGPMTPRM